ncbi:aromatic acid/H+ symport family MFS transporter [Amycolatopsis alkalitolerans]|uniref:Aromatic acid/H+ symport family MFS transporter n=1 Tax=Amycolatopsis alkalitolerans TaxID=2547244 RepID=A0A5C4M711_9PSEU|nr:aromatic acid/H+ symport family MFS transporter [Amycolatopsis alkalitolerans]TNC29147.1 aromatic acid/H+ symport family MFS transporter [Amycolatopsis alkalitolerans]
MGGAKVAGIGRGAVFYPPDARSTGVSWALVVGRDGGILGPLVAGAALGAGWAGMHAQRSSCSRSRWWLRRSRCATSAAGLAAPRSRGPRGEQSSAG